VAAAVHHPVGRDTQWFPECLELQPHEATKMHVKFQQSRGMAKLGSAESALAAVENRSKRAVHPDPA